MFPIRDTQNLGKFPFVNLTLITVNIYVFFQELLAPNAEKFILQYALIPSNINFTSVENLSPFITSMFLHAGFLHIISNMWFLWIFGDNVETIIGHFKYLAFYLICGILATFVQYLFTSSSTLPMVGASGAIAGVLGAYLRNFPRNKIDTIVPIFGLPLIIALPANFILIYWFFIQAFNGVTAIVVVTASVGGIAYIAHVSGFIAGFLLSNLLVWRKF